jgi:hypothetical protein
VNRQPTGRIPTRLIRRSRRKSQSQKKGNLSACAVSKAYRVAIQSPKAIKRRNSSANRSRWIVSFENKVRSSRADLIQRHTYTKGPRPMGTKAMNKYTVPNPSQRISSGSGNSAIVSKVSSISLPSMTRSPQRTCDLYQLLPSSSSLSSSNCLMSRLEERVKTDFPEERRPPCSTRCAMLDFVHCHR